MRNLFIGLLVVAALVIGGGIIAQTAYQAGLSTAVTTAAANAPAGTVVTPVAPYPYPYYGGWGWGHGFPFLGFIGFFLFVFLIFGVMRAIFWRGRGWGGPGGRGGWGGPGGYGPGGYGYGGPGGSSKSGDHDHRARFQEAFDEMHRQSHGEASSTRSDPTTPTQQDSGA
ncbi:MAG: hypothetical protein ACJ77D_02900 [Chloroflexota bacterium]|jgi:hypothetical protein